MADTPGRPVVRYDNDGRYVIGSVARDGYFSATTCFWRAAFFTTGGGVKNVRCVTWEEAVEAMDRGIAVWRLTRE